MRRRYRPAVIGALAGSLLLCLAPVAAATAPTGSTAGAVEVLDTTAPPAPEGLRATLYPVYRDVVLSWSAVQAPDLAGYLVYRSDTTPVALDSAHLRSTATPFDALQFTDTPPFTGATYHYAVVAVDTSGNRSVPAELPVTTTDLTPPPPPTGITSSVDTDAGTFTVSWAPATDPDTVGYRVGTCSGPDGPCFLPVSDPPMTATSFTQSWSGKTVYVTVCAEDAHFQRACSPVVTVQAPQ